MYLRAAALVLAVTLLAGAWAWLKISDAGGAIEDVSLVPRTISGERPVKIVALGTSLTARASWPDDVKTRLQACLGRQVEVLRRAKPGAGSSWGQTQVAQISELHPDLVVVEFAINDADLFDGVTRATSRRQHLDLLAELRSRAPEARVLLLTTNPVAGRARLQRLMLRYYYSDYRQLAEATGAGLVDGYRRWLAVPGWTGDMLDGVHPDPDAESKVLTGPIAAAVARALGSACPETSESP